MDVKILAELEKEIEADREDSCQIMTPDNEERKCHNAATRHIGVKDGDYDFFCETCAQEFRERMKQEGFVIEYDEPNIYTSHCNYFRIVAEREMEDGRDDMNVKEILEIDDIVFKKLPERLEKIFNYWAIFMMVDDHGDEDLICLPISDLAIEEINTARVNRVMKEMWKIMHEGMISDKKIEEMVTKFLYDIVNRSGYTAGKCNIGVCMAREHPTIQQNFMRAIIMPFLKTISEKEYADLRNKATWDIAKVMMKAHDEMEERDRYLPFV
jgi:hypothetical protein